MNQGGYVEMDIIEEQNRVTVRVGNSKLIITTEGIIISVLQKNHPRSA